jgi:microsomal dipeptidase-like Zn-dependent dipeptidase
MENAMTRRLQWIIAIAGFGCLGLIVGLVIGPGMVDRAQNKIIGTQAVASPLATNLHRQLTVVDMHGDTLLWKRNMLSPTQLGHIDLPRLQRGGVALQIFSSVSQVPRGINYLSNPPSDSLTALAILQLQPPSTWFSPLGRTLYHGRKLTDVVTHSDGQFVTIRTRDDLESLLNARLQPNKRQPIGALLSVEGLHNLEGDIANLGVLFDAGVRMAGLVHFFDNEVGGSMHGEHKGGLTPLGRQVIVEMERRGMVIDIAHASHQTVADVLSIATRPIVSSHGGVKATCDENRNLTDEEILGVARLHGVIGVGVWDAAVCGTEPKDTARAMRHIRDLVGIETVGLGTDFDGAITAGYDVSHLDLITQALLDEGFTETEISLALGGNSLRVLRNVLPSHEQQL